MLTKQSAYHADHTEEIKDDVIYQTQTCCNILFWSQTTHSTTTLPCFEFGLNVFNESFKWIFCSYPWMHKCHKVKRFACTTFLRDCWQKTIQAIRRPWDYNVGAYKRWTYQALSIESPDSDESRLACGILLLAAMQCGVWTPWLACVSDYDQKKTQSNIYVCMLDTLLIHGWHKHIDRPDRFSVWSALLIFCAQRIPRIERSVGVVDDDDTRLWHPIDFN